MALASHDPHNLGMIQSFIEKFDDSHLPSPIRQCPASSLGRTCCARTHLVTRRKHIVDAFCASSLALAAPRGDSQLYQMEDSGSDQDRPMGLWGTSSASGCALGSTWGCDFLGLCPFIDEILLGDGHEVGLQLTGAWLCLLPVYPHPPPSGHLLCSLAWPRGCCPLSRCACGGFPFGARHRWAYQD